MKNRVTISDTTSVTKMTGFFASARGLSLRRASIAALAMILLSNRPCGVAFEAMSNLRSEGLAVEHQEVLDDRRQGQRREILQEVENDDHADQEADEQRPVGREGAGGGRNLPLRRQRSSQGQHGNNIGEAAEQHRDAKRRV